MAKGKRRQKVVAAKAKRKAMKAESFKRRENDGPNPNSKYGKRQLERANGHESKGRGHETPPWWSTNKFIMHPDVHAMNFGRNDYAGKYR